MLNEPCLFRTAGLHSGGHSSARRTMAKRRATRWRRTPRLRNSSTSLPASPLPTSIRPSPRRGARKPLEMRAKSAEVVHRVLELLTSAGIGFAAGRVFQRARDEGRINAANAFGLDAFRRSQNAHDKGKRNV